MLNVDVLIGAVPFRTPMFSVNMLVRDYFYVLIMEVLYFFGGVGYIHIFVIMMVVVLFQQLIVKNIQR